MQSLIKYRISGGPVVNANKELIGIISEGDCIKQISESRYYNMPIQDQTIEKYMVKNVDTIDGNMNIFAGYSRVSSAFLPYRATSWAICRKYFEFVRTFSTKF